MLRRVLHIILVVTVVMVTSGVTITRHFCGDSLRSVALMTTPQACCDMEGCCHNETVTILLEDDFTPIWSDVLSHENVIELFPVQLADMSEASMTKVNPHFNSNRKPPPIPLGERLASLQVYIL
ncbi:MAG: hypothetical protein LC649_08245 [Bacteroidales bacterium]|nr:hypothetical protein [Bacteroidales bacterium]